MLSALRCSSRLMVLGALPMVRAMARTPLPARCMSAMVMRSSRPGYLALVVLGLSMSPRYQSMSGFSSRPVDRVLPLRQTFPVRLDTPTARAAWVKFMPPRTRSGYFARLASCMSRSLSYSVPSNSYTMSRLLPKPWCCDVH